MNTNVNPKTIFTGDNLPIMRGMNSESIDLIYLDPPFNSNADYASPIGSKAAGAAFKDTWTLDDVDIAWLDLIEAKHPQLNRVIHAAMTNSDKSYLIYMVVWLLEMHRILSGTGSIYLHCDPKQRPGNVYHSPVNQPVATITPSGNIDPLTGEVNGVMMPH